MREDLHWVLRGEVVAEFVRSDSRQNYSASEIPPTQKSVPFSAQNLQVENETVVRSAPNFEKYEDHKTSNVWVYAMLTLVLVGMIGWFVYLLLHWFERESAK